MDKYTIKVLKPEDWQPILDNLQYTSDGSNHVPGRAVTCIDDMLHSPTRGTFELTEKEAEELKKHDRVEWIELSRLHHLDKYPKPIPYAKRFKANVKIYRDNGLCSDDERNNIRFKDCKNDIYKEYKKHIYEYEGRF